MSVTRTLLFFIALALIATLALLVDGVALFAQAPAPQTQSAPPPAPQTPSQPQDQKPVAEGFRFKSSVELINVSASVFDTSERFVPNLHKEDFVLYEDDKLQQITHFSDERVPVSLGILLDISGSMEGEKFRHATEAIERFVKDILVSKDDEVFLYTFNDYPRMVQGWTNDRDLLMRQLRKQYPAGGTAMNDTVAEAIPYAQRGHNPKKAIVIISDGNDNKSATQVAELRNLIRETEVLLYAIGIDGAAEHHSSRGGRGGWPGTPNGPGGPGGRRWPQQSPSTQIVSPQIIQWPGPTGGGRPPGPGFPPRWPKPDPKDPQQPPPRTPGRVAGMDEGVNSHALRELTDDSGGRTEIVKDGTDLGPATSGIADELSRQYSLAYEPAAKKDGRWHTIRVEAVNRDYRVRARRGYMATP
jgi:Ca-activated chloride channel family protein